MLSQAAKSWISSPLGVNLLLSLFKDGKDTVGKFTKVNHLLKDKTECSTVSKAFSILNNKQIELLKDASSVVQLDSLQDAVSIWVNDNSELRNVNLKKLFPESAQLVLTNVITFKNAWVTPDKCSGAVMKTYNSFSYTEDVKYEARILEFPLRDNEFKFIIIVPNEVDLLHVLFRRLANGGLRAAVNSIQPSFIVKSKLIAPAIRFDSERTFQEEINQLGKLSISDHGSINVNEQGVDIKVLSCIYPTSTDLRPTKVDLTKADPPFFFSLLFQDTPIFVGQFNKT